MRLEWLKSPNTAVIRLTVDPGVTLSAFTCSTSHSESWNPQIQKLITHECWVTKFKKGAKYANCAALLAHWPRSLQIQPAYRHEQANEWLLGYGGVTQRTTVGQVPAGRSWHHREYLRQPSAEEILVKEISFIHQFPIQPYPRIKRHLRIIQHLIHLHTPGLFIQLLNIVETSNFSIKGTENAQKEIHSAIKTTKHTLIQATQAWSRCCFY